jgi:hypothetical protein
MKASSNTPARRKHERVPASMPVHVDDSLGTTRDVSANGVFFEIDSSATMGSEISFSIEMHTALGPMLMKCRGQIVRTEQNGARTGVAVKMIESQLEALE